MASLAVVADVLDELLFLNKHSREASYSEADMERLALLWEKHLKFLSDDQLRLAVEEATRSCRFFPAIADVVAAHKVIRGSLANFSGSDLLEFEKVDNFFNTTNGKPHEGEQQDGSYRIARHHRGGSASGSPG